MSFARIAAVAHVVPDQVISNDDLTQLMDTSDEWIRSRTGIEQRHISHKEQTSDLATKVAQQLLKNASISPDKIDFIIVATITPDSTMPSTAARVQAGIGATNAFAYDLIAACSGFVFGLSTAEKLIKSGAYQCGLVIGAEVFSKIIDWSDRTTAVIFGDGAGGVLLDNTGTRPLIDAEKLQTDGSRGLALSSVSIGLHSPFSEETSDEKNVKMNGREIFEFALSDVPKNIKDTLSKAKMTVEDIDIFLLHQANSRILDKMAKKLGISHEKVLQDIQNYGNTSAASIPILLSESVKNGKIKCDGTQKVVLTGFGGGLTWGTLIINI